eukprot:gene11944-8219_t
MKTALITGGNRGLGFETAAQLEKIGFTVIIGSRDEKKGKEAVRQLHQRGHTNIDCVQLDVTNEASVKKAAEVVKERFNGKLDALINNAGIYCPGESRFQVDLDAVRRSYEVNVIGAMRVTNHFLDLVRKSPAGRIVNVSSDMASIQNNIGPLSATAYSSSKAALNMYTANLAQELRDTAIKVNAGDPGWAQTDMGGAMAPLSVEEGTETTLYLATLPSNGPTGGYFYKKDRVPW